ncbi:MAG: Type 4 prepilin-like protein leader peptide-processing enzyme [Candidatus Magasanikbacteria bacterium GW2011_GWC2_37_14]|uniref:Type 4 prepilin-like protein leader peptide-processing enzyme n=1 Tax=Candidatus Magasanikbacteria bacterium GW2011_GWC2_37_14 TaxID=1619046 RepID=A0A0G0GMQ7_9BACT|nr:MAG: Type 4 prepilin-like protein leader peptide-processing enzyme [Candidatus Magasanikbacteria bacterium GW2011_GWC2_37_14]
MLIYIFIIGLCFGSFLNALVYRIHEKKSLWTRSACPNCQKEIIWYDNIPVFSFLFLKGKCRNCHNKISWQYPLVELALGILFLVPTLFISYPDLKILISLLVQWLIIFDLAFIFLYDYKYQEILDLSIWPLVIFLFDFNYFFEVFSIVNMLIAVAIGGGFFLLQYLISRGRWIGGGDIILGVLMGVILGWPNILLALFIAYILGGIVGVILLLLKKKQANSEIPFGTFLVIGTLVAMWWGNRIVEWYLGLIR